MCFNSLQVVLTYLYDLDQIIFVISRYVKLPNRKRMYFIFTMIQVFSFIVFYQTAVFCLQLFGFKQICLSFALVSFLLVEYCTEIVDKPKIETDYRFVHALHCKCNTCMRSNLRRKNLNSNQNIPLPESDLVIFFGIFRFNEFDHRFFGISDSEVEQMDPQQKQLLQCVYRALENAGIPMEKASGTRTGVFFGKVLKAYLCFCVFIVLCYNNGCLIQNKATFYTRITIKIYIHSNE